MSCPYRYMSSVFVKYFVGFMSDAMSAKKI
jgi:hypothetical protein